MKVYKAPTKPIIDEYSMVLFLAGTIDMGESEDWQARVAHDLRYQPGTILNPRRDAWDSSWEQSVHNPEFKRQVTWELDGLDMATTILVNFERTSKSPISMMELGLHAHRKGRVLVVCPTGFYRKGNVDIVCERYQIPVYEELDQAVAEIKKIIHDEQSFFANMAGLLR